MLSADTFFRKITALAAFSVLCLLAGILFVLARAGWPALDRFGFSFLTSLVWNPVTDVYGGAAPIYGTLVTSFLALILAVPTAFCVAVFLAEVAPRWLARPVGIAVELLAGIPSIIYGMWGLFVLVPFFQKTVEPFLIHAFSGLPVLKALFAGPPYGIGLFTAACVLAIMILPYIAAFMHDVFETVSPLTKESAYAMGATRWDVVRDVVIPATRGGMMGGVMLGLGRALGETMAVTFVIGNAHRISASLFAPGTTISATIANEFNEALGALYPAALLALGLVLFLIAFGVLAAGRLLLLSCQDRGAR